MDTTQGGEEASDHGERTADPTRASADAAVAAAAAAALWAPQASRTHHLSRLLIGRHPRTGTDLGLSARLLR